MVEQHERKVLAERLFKMYKDLLGTPEAVLGYYPGDGHACEPYLHVAVGDTEAVITANWTTGNLDITDCLTGRKVCPEAAAMLLRERRAVAREFVA